MHLVNVTVLNKQGDKIGEFQMRQGTNLWVFLRKRGFPIGAACSGVGVCGACDIKVTSSIPHFISDQNAFEKETLLRNHKSPTSRLACLCRVYEDLTVQADYW